MIEIKENINSEKEFNYLYDLVRLGFISRENSKKSTRKNNLFCKCIRK